ncbi:MAG: helix-turn-helix domain-containing protein [Proteobacteria bacterium]|nr:helix-turn-helix domain-containing protein [Pseudomonadota bacterium]
MLPGRPLTNIYLSADEKKSLEQWSRSITTPKLALRSSLILACAEGKKSSDVAIAFGLTQSTVGKWRARFIKYRIDGLLDKPRSGPPRKISDEDIKRVIDKTKKLSKENSSSLSTRFIAKECGLTQSAVSRIWRSYSLCSPGSKKQKSSNAAGFNEGTDNPETANFKFYRSLGSLIKDYRQKHGINQETLAQAIDISSRELQRWETNRHRAHMNNLHDLSEVTGIPMQVCLALNADQPIWYSSRERRFAYTSIEMANFKIENLLKSRDQSNAGDIERYERVTKDKHISLILSTHSDIYGSKRLLAKDAIKKANKILPDLNYIAFDCWCHYVGHLVCLPMSIEVYEQLKKAKNWKNFLSADRISDIIAFRKGVFFFYSAFMVNASVGYAQLIRSAWHLAKVEQKKSYLAVFNMAAKEVKEFFCNFGARIVSGDTEGHDHSNAQYAPVMYEIELDVMVKRLRSSGALERIIEEQNRKIQMPGG